MNDVFLLTMYFFQLALLYALKLRTYLLTLYIQVNGNDVMLTLYVYTEIF